MNLKNKKRARGVVLTSLGIQKLKTARMNSEKNENFGDRFTFEKLSERTNLDKGTLKKIEEGVTGVDKRTLEKYFLGFDLELEKLDYAKPTNSTKTSWGTASSIDNFIGREKELEILENEICRNNVQLFSVIAFGGTGKTALSIKFASQNLNAFSYVFWRSLREAPPFSEVAGEILEFVCDNKSIPDIK